MRAWISIVPGLLLLAIALILWEELTRYGVIDPRHVTPFSDVLRALARDMANGILPLHYAISLLRSFGGYLAAAVLGIGLGIVMGYFRPVFGLFDPLIELSRPLPAPAIIPVAIVLLGLGYSMKVFIVGWACFFPILLNTIDGVRGVDPTLIQTSRTFGYTQRGLLWKVIIPAASPQIVTGLRISLAISLILVVVAEMIAANEGIGYYIITMHRAYDFPRMYAGVLSLAGVGYALNRLFVALDDRVMAWHKGMSAGAR